MLPMREGQPLCWILIVPVGKRLVEFGLFDRPLARRTLEVVASSFTRTEWCHRAGSRQSLQSPPAGAHGSYRVLVIGGLSTKKKVWTVSTPSAPDLPVRPSDWTGFRMFPPLPSVSKPRNPVRVPPRARHTPSSEGVFALMCVHSGWSGPSDIGCGVCLAPRVACSVVGERVQGRGCGPSACSQLGLWGPLLVRPVGRGWPTPLHG